MAIPPLDSSRNPVPSAFEDPTNTCELIDMHSTLVVAMENLSHLQHLPTDNSHNELID